MAYYIAVDAGGTKTETLLFDETGHILLRDMDKGCNAMAMGVDTTAERAISVLKRVSAHIPGGKPDFAYCGISSVIYYKELRERLNAAFPDWPVSWQDGGISLISSMIDGQQGGCMVCGTGTSLFVRNGDALYHIGGLGYLIDTMGSGYWLGREALLASYKMIEGRGPKTVLLDMVERQMGKPITDSIPDIYDGGRAFIASFARNVFAGRKMGDAVCRDIFERGSKELSDLTWAAAEHVNGEFDVVMSGGIFLNFPEYAQAVIAKSSPLMRPVRATVPPVFGSAKEAVWRHGGVVDAAFKEKMKAEYDAILGK